MAAGKHVVPRPNGEWAVRNMAISTLWESEPTRQKLHSWGCPALQGLMAGRCVTMIKALGRTSFSSWDMDDLISPTTLRQLNFSRQTSPGIEYLILIGSPTTFGSRTMGQSVFFRYQQVKSGNLLRSFC